MKMKIRWSIFTYVLVTWVLIAKYLGANASYSYPCDSPIYCPGPFLEKIQLARIFNDSKTFVDMPTSRPLEEVLAAFSLLPQNASNSTLLDFISTYFGTEGQELVSTNLTDFPSSPSFLQKIESPILHEFAKIVHNYWPNLARKVDQSFMCTGCVSSFIPISRIFVVPGGRFREIYYWDSYFVIEGLLVSEIYGVAKDMILNFLDLVETYGFVPNGSRIYYLNRSQPPLLIQMVKIYYQATNDISLLRHAFPTLIKEYNFWRQNTSVRITSPKSGEQCTLNHYIVHNISPRPESYFEDYETVELATELNSTAKQELYADIATTAESGWDFSSRWVRGPSVNQSTQNYLRKLNTRSVIPIDLNSILYMNEITLSEFSEKIGDVKMAKAFKDAAEKRLNGITELTWNEELGLFGDYNLTGKSSSNFFSLALYFPFWAESLPEDFATNSTKVIRSFSYIIDLLSKYPGSLPTTLINSGLQWDFPNSWAPLNYGVIKGLLNFHHKFLNQGSDDNKVFINLAKNVSQRYVDSVFCAWYSTGGSIPGMLNKLTNVTDSGHIFEKYSALEILLPGGGGEYVVQTGFGWTNGVLLWIFSKFGDVLEMPGCIK